MLRLFYFGSLLLVVHTRAYGQLSQADSSALAATVGTLNQQHARAVGPESGLYSGVEYVNYVKPYVKGHQFFATSEPRDATVAYNGAVYQAVPLRYDLVLDQLVLKSPISVLQMRLLNEQVSRFALSGHTFIRLLADSASNSPIRTGYYDLLVDGPVQLLARRRKSVQETTALSGPQGEVEERNTYFVRKGTQYHEVSSARSITSLFPERKATLRKYARAQQLKFKKTTRESSLLALMQHLAALPAGVPASN